jgi:hypothetical protein
LSEFDREAHVRLHVLLFALMVAGPIQGQEKCQVWEKNDPPASRVDWLSIV